jgi:hypothetical protein
MTRWLVSFFILVVSSPLVAGIMGGSDEYLVIVNESDAELVVRYRVGEFTGPQFEQYLMMNKPMRSPGDKVTRIRKYSPLTVDQIDLDGDTLTLSISPNTAVMVGGIWLGAGRVDEAALDKTPHLEIERPGATIEYGGSKVLSAFERHSKNLRVLTVE